MDKKWQKIIQNYEEHCRLIEQSTTIDVFETPAQKRLRMTRLEADYLQWFAYYFPGYAKVDSADFHKDLSDRIINNKVLDLLAEIYRSGAKSVHLDLGIPLFLMVTGELKFMLLCGETDPKAKRLIGDIQGNLEYNKRLIADYGKLLKYGDWKDGNFLTTEGVRFQSISIGQSARGLREMSERPDYIVVDDVDNKKRCNNERLSREAKDWVWEDLHGTFDEGGERRRFIVANNNFHKNTIINQLKQDFEAINKELREQKLPITNHIISVTAVKDLESFEPAWPAKTSADYWRNKYYNTPYRSFMREYMHKHIQDGTIFKNEHIQYKRILPLEDYEALLLYGDLSYKVSGDFKAMILLGKIGREFHVLKVFCRQTTRTNAARWLYDLYEDWELGKYPVKYMIEGLFAQDELVNDFDEEGDQRGYYIPVIADKKPKDGKFDRIESMSGFFERLNVWMNEAEKDGTDMINLIDQLLAFEKGSNAHDDGPDALQSGISEINRVTYRDRFKPKTVSRSSIYTRKRAW